MNNPKTISRPDRFHYWKEKGEGERRRRIIGWKLTFHQRSRRWSRLLRYAGVTMSRRGERKQCHGIKEQYATRILSHPLLSIYTYIYPCTSWQKGRFFRRALIIGHTESFHDTSSLPHRVEYFFMNHDIYIYIYLSRFIFPFVFSSAYAHASFQFDVVSVCIAYRSLVKNIFEKQRRGTNLRVGCLAGNNT